MIPLHSDYLIGKWNLVSFQLKFWGRIWNWGKNATGWIMYDRDGKMNVDIKAEKTLVPYISNLIFHNRLTYDGSYTIQKNLIIHHLDNSSKKSWIGKDQVREIVQLDEQTLELKGASKDAEYSLVWTRSKDVQPQVK